MKEARLNSGATMPSVGLGTWLIGNSQVDEVVKTAVEVGYRLIDTAQAYMNEEGVGRGVRECGVAREELFITSKVMAEHKSYTSAKRSIDKSLEKLGLDYLDLMLIHAPQPWMKFRTSKNNYFKENREVWRALEDAQMEGKVKAIGVSNFHIEDLQNILNGCRVRPAVNQVLAHVGQTPFKILDFCKKEKILVEAYSPIAHGEAERIGEVEEMAQKYGKSFAQICLKYDLQLGMVVLPKASSEKHLRENLDLDFVISEEDMDVLKNVVPLEDYGKDDWFPVFRHSGE